MLIAPLHRPQRTVRLRYAVGLVAGAAALLALAARIAGAQGHDHELHAAEPPKATRNSNAELHMEMTPAIRASAADSARAARVATALRAAIGRYKDTTAAVVDGYHMFLPKVKNQKVYHFTNNWRAVQESFRFDPAKPTSLLYKKDSTGKLVLVGAMYTAPKRFDFEKLNERVPLSIARWHKHVNWCLPKRGETARWVETRDGQPLFGPESPVATKEACDVVGGRFFASPLGWMLHANVMTSDDPAVIWGDEHAGPDMHSSMKMEM